MRIKINKRQKNCAKAEEINRYMGTKMAIPEIRTHLLPMYILSHEGRRFMKMSGIPG